MFHIDQDFYMSEIEPISFYAKFSKFASMRMKPALLANIRLDLLFEVSQIEQGARGMYDQDVSMLCKLLKKVINFANEKSLQYVLPSYIKTHFVLSQIKMLLLQ